jgi:phenylacetate-coenzyme A ligase PaaK-like adenylate-forming protein
MDNPLLKKIFDVRTLSEFEKTTMEVFRFQAENNPVYCSYIESLGMNASKIRDIHDIPFLPVEFFKSFTILTGRGTIEKEFISSGTTGVIKSRHSIYDISIYERSFIHAFELRYGNLKKFCILALLPGYLEQRGSSLVYMVDALIQRTGHPDSGFYLDNFEHLRETLNRLQKTGQRILLFGVSFALLEFAEFYHSPLQNTIVMETGGMKGRKKEITREELHHRLSGKFSLSKIHSEYGMTELLSQAYSGGGGIFYSPPWMKILIRDTYDPFHYLPPGRTGGINIIDLANINSLSFIETQDLGRIHKDQGFEVLGRFDQSDTRGCNLLLQDL